MTVEITVLCLCVWGGVTIKVNKYAIQGTHRIQRYNGVRSCLRIDQVSVSTMFETYIAEESNIVTTTFFPSNQITGSWILDSETTGYTC